MKEQTKTWLDEVEGPAKQHVEALVDAYRKYGYPRMASITPEFVDKLKSRNYPSLRIDVHNLPDETHLSVGPAAWSRGLRYVYGVWEP
jgi:2-oxoglutarate dehydrogenase complex dehydrogenase (E1) component-like enzyme